MSFNELAAFTQKVSDAADQIVGNPVVAKAIFDAAPEELRTYFNNLVKALKATTIGDSGAKNTGATAITGLTGTDVQSLLQSLYDVTVKKETSWNTPATFNYWSNYGNGYYDLKYKKDDLGNVYIRGALKNPQGGNAYGTLIFQLPVGCRPSSPISYEVKLTNGVKGSIIIDRTGDVIVDTISDPQQVFLPMIIFPADQ